MLNLKAFDIYIFVPILHNFYGYFSVETLPKEQIYFNTVLNILMSILFETFCTYYFGICPSISMTVSRLYVMSINGRYISSRVMDSMKFLEFAATISHCREAFYNRENTTRIDKKQ